MTQRDSAAERAEQPGAAAASAATTVATFTPKTARSMRMRRALCCCCLTFRSCYASCGLASCGVVLFGCLMTVCIVCALVVQRVTNDQSGGAMTLLSAVVSVAQVLASGVGIGTGSLLTIQRGPQGDDAGVGIGLRDTDDDGVASALQQIRQEQDGPFNGAQELPAWSALPELIHRMHRTAVYRLDLTVTMWPDAGAIVATAATTAGTGLPRGIAGNNRQLLVAATASGRIYALAPYYTTAPGDSYGALNRLVYKLSASGRDPLDADMGDSLLADLSDRVYGLTGAFRGGLLGMDLHPDFANNGRLYVCYAKPWEPPSSSATDGQSTQQDMSITVVVSEMSWDAEQQAWQERVLRTRDRRDVHRTSGWLGYYAADNVLYVSFGPDYGPGGHASQQDGRIERIDVASGAAQLAASAGGFNITQCSLDRTVIACASGTAPIVRYSPLQPSGPSSVLSTAPQACQTVGVLAGAQLAADFGCTAPSDNAFDSGRLYNSTSGAAIAVENREEALGGKRVYAIVPADVQQRAALVSVLNLRTTTTGDDGAPFASAQLYRLSAVSIPPTAG
jgi:hypothetical protein